jgi:hypothetical protein
MGAREALVKELLGSTYAAADVALAEHLADVFVASPHSVAALVEAGRLEQVPTPPIGAIQVVDYPTFREVPR